MLLITTLIAKTISEHNKLIYPGSFEKLHINCKRTYIIINQMY